MWRWLLILGSACGPKPAGEKQLSPTAAFDALRPEDSETMSLCDVFSNGACSSLFASGPAVAQSFNYRGLITKCTHSSAQGTTIHIQNHPKNEHATMILGITLFGRQSPKPEVIDCFGPEYESVGENQFALKAQYCNVTISVHDKMFAATKNEFCEVTILSEAPLQGELNCPVLQDAGLTLSIDSQSHFSCGKEQP